MSNQHHIDCSLYNNCPFFIKVFNSCPTKQLFKSNSIFSIDLPLLQSEYKEFLYMGISTLPYILSGLIILYTIFNRTLRSFTLMIMFLIENIITDVLKNNLRHERPNFQCTRQYGNPSNHAVFYSGLVIWSLFEKGFISKKYKFRTPMNIHIVLLLILTPITLYSRIHLKYHSLEQVITGLVVGGFVSFVYLSIVYMKILTGEWFFIINVLKKLGITNNMSDFNIYNEEEMILRSQYKGSKYEGVVKKYNDLLKKQEELSNMKESIKSFKEGLKDIEFFGKEPFYQGGENIKEEKVGNDTKKEIVNNNIEKSNGGDNKKQVDGKVKCE